MSAGGAPVPGISHVGTPVNPPGVMPNLTQYPAAPITNNPPPGYPSAGYQPTGYQPTGYQPTGYQPTGYPPTGYQPTGYQPAGYPPTYQSAPGAQTPPLARVPGPYALGTAPDVTVGGRSGVPGVSLAPVVPVSPPMTTGGPHPLPSMPPVPLPAGFPNPFALQQLQAGQQPQTTPSPVPGTQYATGPQGYLPGLGYFGSPGTGALPGVPGPLAAPAFQPMAGGSPNPWGQPTAPMPAAFPVLPGAYPFAAPQALLAQVVPSPQPEGPSQPASVAQINPFWLQLSFQMIQTPAVRAALGDRFQSLLEGDNRGRLTAIGAGYLAGPELQAAFRGLQDRTVDQSKFTELFAAALKSGLQSVGLLPPG
jgi:hypothetical protein